MVRAGITHSFINIYRALTACPHCAGAGRDSKIKEINKVLALWTIEKQRKSVLRSRREMKLWELLKTPPLTPSPRDSGIQVGAPEIRGEEQRKRRHQRDGGKLGEKHVTKTARGTAGSAENGPSDLAKRLLGHTSPTVRQRQPHPPGILPALHSLHAVHRLKQLPNHPSAPCLPAVPLAA